MHCCMSIRSLGFIFLILNTPFPTTGSELEDFKRDNPDLSEFLKLMETGHYLMLAVTWKRGTLLIPTNQAIREYQDKFQFGNDTLVYHYSPVALLLDALEDQEYITSDLPLNDPISITKTNASIFFNDAKVLRGNLKLKLKLEQTVHVIDKVLKPTTPTDVEEFKLYNPTARKVIENSAKYGLTGNFLTTKFAMQMNKVQAGDLLGNIGRRTFFVPVDDAFKINSNITYLDRHAIQRHIIPNRAIYLRTIENGQGMKTYKTMDHEPDSRVFISLTKEIIDGKDIWIVKSDNREGEKNHPKGVVQSRIVKGNIPVKNGVVHLMSNPLVITDIVASTSVPDQFRFEPIHLILTSAFVIIKLFLFV